MKFKWWMVAGLFLLIITSNSYAENNASSQIIHLSYKDGRSIKISHQAIITKNGIAGVYVLQNGQARFRMVRLGKKTRNSIYILAGLFGDEKIILSNASELFDGMPVNISPEIN